MSSLRRVIKADQVRLTSAGQLVASRPPLARTATEQRFGPDPAVAAIEAQQILQVAQDRAAEIQRAAQEQAAETARQARAEGLRAAEAEIAQLLLSAHGVLDEVEAWRQRLLARSEPVVIELVSTIARKLAGDGLVLAPEQLQRVFNQALAEARSLGALRVRVNPEDAALLDAHWPPPGSASQNLEVVPDPDIRRGGCLIEGDYGQVDARVDSQLALTLEALTQVAADAAESGEHHQ